MKKCVAAVLLCLLVGLPQAGAQQTVVFQHWAQEAVATLGGTQHRAQQEPAVPARLALGLYVALTENYLLAASGGLELAAGTHEVQSGRWDRMAPLLQTLQKSLPPGLIWFARPDGSYFTTEQGAAGVSLADRPYFPRLLAGQKVTGEVFVGKTSRRASVLAAVPVLRSGKVVGALGASLYLDSLSELLKADMKLPADMVFFAVDPAGTATVLNFKPERIFQDPTAQAAEPALAEAIRTMVASSEGVLSYDFTGGRRTVVYGTSRLLGWHFALGTVTP